MWIVTWIMTMGPSRVNMSESAGRPTLEYGPELDWMVGEELRRGLQ